ncbi:M23 family metallopeptidase [Jejuia pallidilutea]|uniref:Peptidase n=3 Tax=Jejuia pallidilutea TaxID=504487 RepID=A0A090VPI4_9FLAO|nr:M23 family metallopeptidase [Jejuia pallidilutea]GAL66621.1 peptidase [Jejuia pallidilutea]
MILRLSLVVIIIMCASCSKTANNKGNIVFKLSNDSLKVVYKNPFLCPAFTKVKNIKNGDESYVESEPKETSLVMSFKKHHMDTTTILNTYKFTHYYGFYEANKQAYDTLFNYALPFSRGKQYKIIQGYNGDFTHNTKFSRYTLDFNLKIGDTINTSRDGVVIKIIEQHNKQGTTKKYRPYGNHIIIYHKDNTFAQYVHLKQYGSLVKVGDSDKTNQPIALSGFTGLTTIPHLHFGVFKATTNGFISIPILLDAIPGKKYTKNKIAVND